MENKHCMNIFSNKSSNVDQRHIQFGEFSRKISELSVKSANGCRHLGEQLIDSIKFKPMPVFRDLESLLFGLNNNQTTLEYNNLKQTHQQNTVFEVSKVSMRNYYFWNIINKILYDDKVITVCKR